jgi:hypothetical protein
MQTRGSFLKSVGAVASALAVAESASAASPEAVALGRRFGRTVSPRLSISLPPEWFLTEKLTDVSDPIQLFAVSNRVIPAPHANVHGVANLRLIPSDGVLSTGHAFVITPDMAVYSERTSAPPSRLQLAGMQEGTFGENWLKTYSWFHFGQTFGVDVLVWVSTSASASDVQILDQVFGSLTFDEPL